MKKIFEFLFIFALVIIPNCLEMPNQEEEKPHKPPVIDKIDELKCACGTSDLIALATQDTFSSACRQALLNFLPPSQDDISNCLISLGTGIVDSLLTLFYAGTGSSASFLNDSTGDRGLFRYDAGIKTLVDSARYLFKSLKDFNNTVVSISSIQDYSGSMSNSDIDESVNIFSDLFSVATLTDRFETNIILFSDTVLSRMNFSSNADTISKYISRDDNFGRKRTRLFDALGTGFNDLSSRKSPIKLIIISTDGKENASTLYTSKQEIYALSKQYRIPVIILGSLLADLGFMKEISRETSGAFIYSRTITELKGKSVRVANMLENAAGIVLDSALTKSPPDSFSLEGNGKRIIFNTCP